MGLVNRRRFLALLSASPLAIGGFPWTARAVDCRVQHPFMPPDDRFHGQCPVCGMIRPMWARTWITFDPQDGVDQVCSFHCLADWSLKSGQDARHVKLTVYHDPEMAIPAEKAFIVMGSTAAGTMSPVSKIVFADRPAAEAFAAACGGAVVGYSKALLTAKTSAVDENRNINARRLETGKIVEPSDGDPCIVCGMFPQRYPYGKCQIQTRDGRTFHFCSTQCLFAFLGSQTRYTDAPIEPLLIWVVDRSTGMWISGRTAFYVVGSSKVFGPMGHEAFPFHSRKEAQDFAETNGGRPLIFDQVTIDQIVPQWSSPARRKAS